jgi:hypothetical protein
MTSDEFTLNFTGCNLGTTGEGAVTGANYTMRARQRQRPRQKEAGMRSGIKTFLLKSSLGRFVLECYSKWFGVRLLHLRVKSECKKLRELLNAGQASIQISYDTSVYGHHYGDFIAVVMLARYLKASGAAVTFFILDNGSRRDDWELLDLDQQMSVLQDLVELSSKLLDAETEVLPEALNSTSHIIFGANSPKDGPPAALALLLTKLVETSEGTLPEGFLLPTGWGKEIEEDLGHRDAPYVAWNVRKGKWGLYRDNTEEQVIADFRELRKLCPDRRIVLLSTPGGIEWVFSILQKSGDLYLGADDAQILFPQPKAGFTEAMLCILSAEEYFQREGGGMVMVAIFSQVPYLMVINFWTSYLGYQLHGDKIVPWASPRQRFLHRPLDSQRVPFGDLYNQTSEAS